MGAWEIARAIPKVLAREPRAFFIFLRGRGDPNLETKLRHRLDEVQCSHRILWIDRVLALEEMAVVLNLADAFISIPKTDLLSLSLLEGMACGCIPIAADLLAYKTRLQDGANAVLVPTPVTAESLARAILRVAQHPEWKRPFAQRNQKIVREEDDWAKNAQRMEEVYRWAIRHPR